MFLFLLNCYTQDNSGIIVFKVKEYNFGSLKKYTGEVTYLFEFTNKGTSPVVIEHVISNCECATISWTKEPIEPGMNGSIKVYLNPDYLEGYFNKNVIVKSNASNKAIALSLKGSVAKSETKETYDFAIDELGMKSKHINMGIINKGEIKTRTMSVINNSDKTLSVEFLEIPSYTNIDIAPNILQPGETGYIHVEYHSELINNWDYIIDKITVVLNGKKNTKTKLTVTSNIVEDFSKYSSEQLLNAPVSYIPSTIQQLDTIKSKKIMECKYLIKNYGKSDLIIRDVNPSCGCTAVKPEKSIIPPNDSTYIVASFNPKSKIGDFSYSIAVITNDPKNNRQYLWIKGYIKD